MRLICQCPDNSLLDCSQSRRLHNHKNTKQFDHDQNRLSIVLKWAGCWHCMSLAWYLKGAPQKKSSIETFKYYIKELQEASTRCNPESTWCGEKKIDVISHHTLLIGTPAKGIQKGLKVLMDDSAVLLFWLPCFSIVFYLLTKC